MEREAKLNELKGKYEVIMVISKEARRINNRLRGQNVEFKVTSLAMDRYSEGRVKWEYWEAPEPTEVSLDAVEGMAHSATAAGLAGAIEEAAAASDAAEAKVDESSEELAVEVAAAGADAGEAAEKVKVEGGDAS
ncbi:MAG: hypothetical protein CME06_03470 [Gemmatimonadetes bacterium]|nr:hypothetical protein [Gemmatimonadota bacterium]